MIPVALTQGVRAGAADRPAPNHALETVAEELLNGMFCTYEPPPPSASPKRRPKKRGILRASTAVRRHRSDLSAGTKSVRWVDTQEEEDEAEEEEKEDAAAATRAGGKAHPHVDFHCNVACLDANLGAGCFAPKGPEEATTVGKAAKSSGKKKLGEEIVFDGKDDPKSLLRAAVGAPPPPPPPPPTARESYVPQLCGVKINCGGDDDDEPPMEEPARPSHEGASKTYHRPRQDYDYEDEMDNSLIEEEEDVAAIDARLKRQHQAILRKRMEALRERQAGHRQKKKVKSGTKEEADWDDDRASTVSGSSSLFRRVFNKKGARNEDEPSSGRGRSMNRSRSPHRDETLDPIHTVQAGSDFRRTRAATSGGDWDESIPIVPGNRSGKGAQLSQSEEKSIKHYRQPGVTSAASRSNESMSRDPSPGIVRTRSRSLDDDENAKGSRWSLSSKNKQSSRRSKSPNRPRSSSPSPRVRNFGKNTQTRSLSEKEIAKFNYMHPTYPQRRNPDEMMERESMITAHRNKMDTSESSVTGMENDQFERQSYITAHRDGFSDIGLNASTGTRAVKTSKKGARIQNGTIHPLVQNGYRNYDDMLERQSFITESRQNFDDIPRSRSCGLFDVMEEEPRDNSLSKPSPQKPGQSLEVIAEAKARERIRQSLEAFPNSKSSEMPVPQHGNLQLNDGSCFPQHCLPMALSNHPVVQPNYGIDRQLQAQQQAQLQRQYYERIRSQQAKARMKGNGRQQRLSLSLPFLRRSRSRPSSVSRSRSSSPSRLNTARRRSRSLDLTGAQVHKQTHNQQKLRQQVFPPTASTAETKRILEEPPASEHKKEMTWEERTQQAWERLRSGTIFETAKEDIATDEKAPTQLRTTEAASKANEDENAPKSFFQSALAMLTENSMAKEDLVQDGNSSVIGNQRTQTSPMILQNQYYRSPIKNNGIARQSSFDQRRVTFGGESEQVYHSDSFSHLVSPQKRKVFKGTKIITGLFGRADRKSQKSSKEQSMGLQQTHTRSTDLSSCPSTDGRGVRQYHAGSMAPYVPSIVDGGCLDTLSHLRHQAHRCKDGPQDPSGPIAY